MAYRGNSTLKTPQGREAINESTSIPPKHSFPKAVKYAALTGMAALTFLTSCVYKPSTTTPTTTTTQTTTSTTPSISYDADFLSWIDHIRAEGKTDVAGKLFSLYSTEPGVAKSLSYLELAHPDVAELLMQQPWYSDGLSDSEKKFIEYGFGSGEYGISSFTNMDELMKKIIVNQQYIIDTIQLSQGLTYIVELYDRNDDPISKENVDLTMKLVKAYAPDVEQFEGARYPLPAITVLAENDRDSSQTFAFNGTVDTAFSSKPIDVVAERGLGEEVGHVMDITRIDRMIISNGFITEGIANLSSSYFGEKLSQNPPSWWKSSWNTTMQVDYSSWLAYLKQSGAWELPLDNLADRTYYEIAGMGYLFMKNLLEIMGTKGYTSMLAGMYDYKTANPSVHVDGTILEKYALESSPAAVEANVKTLCDAWIFGIGSK